MELLQCKGDEKRVVDLKLTISTYFHKNVLLHKNNLLGYKACWTNQVALLDANLAFHFAL